MKTLKNLDTSFKTMKFILFGVVLSATAIVLYNTYSSHLLIEKSREKVYVLKDGEALELALSRNPEYNRKAEIKNHLEMFHQFFFNLDPDPKDIKYSIGKALYLIDDSGKQLHYAREEELYYHKIVDGSITSRILVDSVQVNMTSAPYVARIYCKQKLVRPTTVVYKNLITQCQLRDIKRTDNNPHGLLMERFQILDNSTTHEKPRR